MRKITAILLAITTLFVLGVACNKNKYDEKKYDYTVGDVEMESDVFSMDELLQKKAEVAYITDNFGIEGYMLDGMPYNGQTSKAFFWLGKPSGEMPEGGWPAVMLIHGGGGNAFSDWVAHWTERGYVALALDIAGHAFDDNLNMVVNKQFLCDGTYGSIGCGTDVEAARRSWTYMNVCNVILAHTYLRGLECVNADKTVITGISWGAFVTCIVSGLDKRFQAYAPVYGCSIDRDSWGLHEAGLIGLTAEAREEWRSVYDPSAYLPYCTKPILFTSGMTDHAFSPVSHKKSTELIPGKVFYNYASSLAHGHYWYMTPCVEEFFEHILNGTTPEINFLSASCQGGIVRFELETEVDSVALAYTTDTSTDSHEWTWKNLELEAKKGVNEVAVPEGAVALTVVGYSDNSDYSLASTDIFFPVGFEHLI